MKWYSIIMAFLLCISTRAQETTYDETEVFIETAHETIQGNLIKPNKPGHLPLVILIPGSGPTDRNGNNTAMTNNSLKYLAEGLAANQIASYRYDKSVLTFGADGVAKVEALTFETFIEEATAVIQFFQKSEEYSKIIVAGHSQGSLVGMVASQGNADGFVSLAGAGRPIGAVLVEQIGNQAPFLKEETERIVGELEAGNTVTDFNPALNSLFYASVQPFLMSWMKYDPMKEIEKLDIPVLIVNGAKDIQVQNTDAELLLEAKPSADLYIIDNMNHLLKKIEGDRSENMASYTNPDLPVIPVLLEIMSKFIRTIE